MGSSFVKGGTDLWDFGKNLALGTWNELGQLPATLKEFPKVFGEDWDSGAMRDRFAGMFEYGGGVLDTAAKFWTDPDAMKDAISKYGPELVDGFLAKARELDKAMMSADPLTIRAKIGEIAGTAEWEALIGGLGEKGVGYAIDLRNTAKVNATITEMRTAANEIEVATMSAEDLARREALFQKVADGTRVKVTMDAATDLLSIDRRILLERQATILQYSEGAAEDGAYTVYKLSSDADAANAARQLREQYPDLYTGKLNTVADKGFTAGEDALMSETDKLKFAQTKPGEVVNYTPEPLSDADRLALPDDLREVYDARMSKASTWDHYEGFENRKTIDLTDPAVTEKYGPMWVAEDPANPATAVDLWKDPVDGKIYTRYQTADGTWSDPKIQVSDVDTVTHGGGTGLTYEQSTDLQYKQSFGQLGEGDTPQWTMNMLEKNADGTYVLKDGADPKMLVKAIDQLRKAETQPVLTQSLDGLYLEKVSYPELQYATQAAQTITWDADTTKLLQTWNVLP
jgi:hypothetical protein